MKLYYAPGACSLADHIVAVEGGLEPDLEKVDLKTHLTESGADYRQINPKGYVPALRLDDGSLLTENVAILTFLGDETGLMPEGRDRYRVLEWIGYINSEIHKSFASIFRGASDEDQGAAREKITKRLKLVEERLTADFLLGDRLSPPDAYLYVMLRWCAKTGIDVASMPRLAAFKTRMEARPGVQKAMKDEGY